MIILKAIGGFFVKIGRWIKNTAWVQPLLIVGVIFGVIFAIRPTVDWVKSWFATGDAAEKYHSNHALSWDGVDKGESQVDRLFKYMEDLDNQEGIKEFGSKFFVVFYTSECDGCSSNYYGFNYLESKFGTGEFVYDSKDENKFDFKLYTINCSTIDESDDDKPTYFTKYIYGDAKARYGDDIFAGLVGSGYETPYLNKTFSDKNILGTRWGCDSSTEAGFYTPTVLLIENQNYYSIEHYGEYGVSEVMFEFSGEDDGTSELAKARTVWSCWLHQNDFADKK